MDQERNESKASYFASLSYLFANFAVQYSFCSASIAIITMSSSVCTNTQALCNRGKQASWVGGASNAAVLVGAE